MPLGTAGNVLVNNPLSLAPTPSTGTLDNRRIPLLEETQVQRWSSTEKTLSASYQISGGSMGAIEHAKIRGLFLKFSIQKFHLFLLPLGEG